jgi:Ser/Thr protein kinase RdoA (MazF antagonist)
MEASSAHFSVSHSILAALDIGQFVQRRYALPGAVTCSLIKSGINASYALQAGNVQYVFRVYTHAWRSEAEVDAEVQLLLHLQEHHLAAAYPLVDAVGGYVQRLAAPEGERLAVLFTHAPGEKTPLFTAEAHAEVGRWMGRFHQLTLGRAVDRVTYTPQILLLDSLPKLSRFLPEDCAEMTYLHKLQTHLLALWAQADTTQLRSGVVHIDIWFDNLHVDDDGAITVFDFDFLGNGWLCLDVAYYVLQLHNIERDLEARQQKLDHFLAGYLSVVALSDEERRLLPMLGLSLYFFYLGIQCERYENWSNAFLNTRYLKRFTTELVRRYAEENGVLVDG